jgi:uridine phosphorylase
MKAKPPRKASPNKNQPRKAKPQPRVLRRRYPILEFDTARTAVLEPSAVAKPSDVPEHCVLCFFQDVIDGLRQNGAREVGRRRSELGNHPIHEIDFDGRRLVVVHPRVGAPMAAAMLEALIAMGCRKFVACGGAGVLNDGIAVGHVIVPTAAIRDEGTSYHYLPASREIEPSPRAIAAIQTVLEERGYDYLTAKTWTTDGLYRETRKKVLLRKREGCLTVEMEAAAFFAVAKFRGVEFGQILYAGDDLSGEWDHRNWMRHEVREHLFRLAAESCLKL